jgi:hypothetical protein
MGSCEHSNECLGSVKGGDVEYDIDIDALSHSQEPSSGTCCDSDS